MKKWILILFCSLFLLSGFAQTGHNMTTETLLDSMRNELKAAKNDSIKARVLVGLTAGFMYTNMDSTLYYGDSALKIAEENGFMQEKMGATGFRAIALVNRGNLPKALQISMDAIELGKSLPVKPDGVGPNYDNVQFIYFLIGDYDRAKEFARKEAKLGPPAEEAFGYWNIANIFEARNEIDSAMYYLGKSRQTFEKLHLLWYPEIYDVYPHWYNTRAKIYFKQGKAQQALNDFHHSLQMSLKSGESILSGVTFIDVANFYHARENRDSSIYYAVNGLNFCQKSSYAKGILDAASLLATLYERSDPAKALHYLKLKEEQQNNLFGAGNMDAIRQMMQQAEEREKELAAAEKTYRNRLLLYALLGGLAVVLFVAFYLYRNNRQKQKANTKLNQALSELKATQSQLIQAEKMASLGELTAGIAHEIQNPLNFVNNFSEVNDELIDEMNGESDIQEIKAIGKDVKENNAKISLHGKRADAIVKNMLEHSRSGKGEKQLTDINSLCDEYLRLAYHGMRVKEKDFNSEIKTDFDNTIGKIKIAPQDIGRVLLNLFNNAFYAVNEKAKVNMDNYQPQVMVKSRKDRDDILISVIDNGSGIQNSIKEKIFQPFFTTKPTGNGTGLGLSLSYDIIKAHGGVLKVESGANSETKFIIQLPIVEHGS